VFGVDVGYGQVAERVRTDPRAVILERTNLRTLPPDALGGVAVDLVTLDLSFISVLKVCSRGLASPCA
jgi:23S rRNA (cytidine1920-2'-O)/16S rRNA (cytidine1409-2'-O)-methyltransferase